MIKKIRLIAFDLDNTLAMPGKGILPEDIDLLRNIENQGAAIAICSGKPVDYLCGLMRQAGLARPILIGENGAVIQIGIEFPPKDFHILPYSTEAQSAIRFLKAKISELLPDLWYQPNIVGLTPFPASDSEFEIIADCINRYRSQLQDIIIYRHSDSFDITPVGADKQHGLQYLGKLLDIAPQETAAVGDGINDYPMFAYAAYSVGINVRDADKVNINLRSSSDALKHLLKMLENR